ncbi:IclR family transcriptional regulator C-terminal domain-containing protein [Streptomyces sp. NPDC046887]|uniref:IclR family transcriptional regulator domain-containing protein n=1 Tax=Streptomyces sp. NPDC046887 TaxID=3155472 RepID=UPI0033E00566
MSRFNQDDGGPGTALPAELWVLRQQLIGEPDFWDRPEGYAVPADDPGPSGGPSAVDQREANSRYRLGTRALRRGELATAGDWLGEAAQAGHPGALFRLAVVALRAGGDGGDEGGGGDWAAEVVFLVAEAARRGHGDARRLLAAGGAPGRADARARADGRGYARARADGRADVRGDDRGDGSEEGGERIEDPEFYDEVRLGIRLRPPVARDPAPAPGPGRRLALVPAPQEPPLAANRTSAPTAALRPRLRAVEGDRRDGPVPVSPASLPYLDMVAAGAVAAARADTVTHEGESRWSPNVLRSAHLTDLSRSPVPPAAPPRWQTNALLARDLLLLIQGAGGISTRDLARRTRMSLSTASGLVEWLTRQFLVETVDGAHHPGAVLEMATGGDTRNRLMQQTMDALRDRLGAAVYLSTYTNGEIALAQSSHSGSAPPVRVGVPFPNAGHASANGKALLADLNTGARLEHLARHRPVSLTSRTITDPRALFDTLDRHGPRAVQFDLLEYSPHNVCAALSLTLPGHDTACVALSLPADDHNRLVQATAVLSEASTGLLVIRLLHTATTSATEAPGPTPADPADRLGATAAR